MQQAGPQFVVLAYGESPFLSACLASLRRQTLESEVVVTTSTPCQYIASIAAQYDAAVKVNDARRGIASDWNFALSQGTGALVTLAHQDDVYYPQFAAKTRALFAQRPDASLAFTDYDEIDETGALFPTGKVLAVKRAIRTLIVGEREIVDNRQLRRLLLALGNSIPCPSVTFNSGVIGDFRFSEDFAINLDWDAWWRLHALRHPFVQSPARLMGHRLHRSAETSRGKVDGRRWIEDRAMFDRIWPFPIGRTLAHIYRLGY